MKRIEIFWQKIRPNLDIYLTVAISLVVAVLGIVGVASQTVISAAVLATLALVSTSMLQNRRENSSLRDLVSQLQNASEFGEPFLGREPTSYSSQNEFLSIAQKAFFWGLTFERMIPHVRYTLEHRLQSGLDARFLILERESNAVKMAAFRDPYRNQDGEIDAVLDTVISDLKRLTERVTAPAKLEVRAVDFLPPCTVIAFDPHLPNGQMYVSLLPFRGANENRPTFKLRVVKEKEWVRMFTEQFEALWKEAKTLVSSDEERSEFG